MTTPRAGTPDSSSTLKRALRAIDELQRKVDAAHRAASEPIAVVGVGCRFPGGAVDPDSFWQLLRSGTDAVGEIPPDRWDVEAFYQDEPGGPGKMTTRCGGFLADIAGFDPGFFGISRREATTMDPQQRLVLEVAWEALEHAGVPPTGLASRSVGVFLGACSYDYATMNFAHPLDASAYASTGTAHSVLAGRLSYLLDLRGPSVAIDTACSSSLVAVHLACQSLRSGECDLALSGGVNLILSPLPSIAFSQFGMLAPDGRCKTFDAAADGFGRGEGCGAVVLKRLSDAVRDNDDVLAVVRGTVVNQDGRSSGLTAPNALAQRELLARALTVSGVSADQVSYIEAHGTGTPLGDPIEVEALSEVYGSGSGPRCHLGSVKTNIGHLEAAAGIAGLIKVVLSLRHRAIPPHLHFQQLNPHISLAGTPFVVPTRLEQWEPVQGRRIAAVSSFGFSGTNAQVMLEEGPTRPVPAEDCRRPLSVLALSAKNETALRDLAGRYRDQLASDQTVPVADLCYSANTGRSHFPCRAAVVAKDRTDFDAKLAGLLAREPATDGFARPDNDTKVVFLFTGQGSQRSGMARQLYETQPTFRRTLDQCDEILRPVLETPLRSIIYPADPDSGLLDQTAYTQPALFAVEYALARMWQSWGVEPAAVLGHSLGEYVAACVAGMMSLADGLRLVAERARLMQALPKNGSMMVVFAPAEEIAGLLADRSDALTVAAVNGPANTVVSGDYHAAAALGTELQRRGVRTKQLRVSHAFHSPLVEPILDQLRHAAAGVSFSAPRVPLVSNLTGALWPWDQAPDADYWCSQARQPVQFARAVTTLRDLGYDCFLELGPAPTLLGLVRQCIPPSDSTRLPSLRPGKDDWEVALPTLAQLYQCGVEIDWQGFDRDYSRARVPVPTYPFARNRCWYEPQRPAGARADWHDLPPAGDRQDSPDGIPDDELLYQIEWRLAENEPGSGSDPVADVIWLVLADETGIGDELAALLAARGSRCVRVAAGSAYQYDGAQSATVRVGSAEDLSRLLRAIERGPVDEVRVVHLFSQWEPATVAESEAMLLAQKRICLSAVQVVQALATVDGPGPARLWLVTRGAVQPAGAVSTPTALAQSTLWGLGRSLQQEHPAFWGGLIDLDPQAAPPAAAAELLRELERDDGEDQVALRGSTRQVARLVRAARPDQPPSTMTWRRDASYLITGGLGDLGLAVARSMVLAGARRLVLVGRTPLPPRGEWTRLADDDPLGRRVAAVRELESLGASVIVRAVDVADEARLRAFLTSFTQEGWPPIRGVVHAAGSVEPGPLLDLAPTDLMRQLRPKLMGAWLLHRLLDQPLDFFVLFSSASAVLSSPFISGYAAANAFLDALAQHRRAVGAPALSINWGYWAQIGIAARQEATVPRTGHGMGALPPEQALRVFHRLLRQEAAQVAVLPIDWARWSQAHPDACRTPFLAGVVGPEQAAPAARSGLPTPETLRGLPASERLRRLTAALTAGVATALGTTPEEIGVDVPLFELGLDSLLAVELKNQIELGLGISLPIAAFLQDPSIRRLAEQVLARVCPADAETGDAAEVEQIPRLARRTDRTEALLAEIAQLPEEQARTLLERET